MTSNKKKPALSSTSWYDPILLRAIPPLSALLIKLLMGSCRLVHVEGLEREKNALMESKGQGIYPTWHQRMSYLFHYLGPRKLTVMISQSRDGEYAARLAWWLGFRNTRGSSTRAGSRALRQIIRRLRAGENGGMLADGPKGPARVAKPGTIIMARSARVPLIPLVWGADRCWMFNSWDRYLVPKPFARVVLYFCEPLWIPLTARGEEIERHRKILEDRLNRATRWCDEYFGEERPWRKKTHPGVPETGPLEQA